MTGSLLVLMVAMLLLPGSARTVESIGSAIIAPVQSAISGILDEVGGISSTVSRVQGLAQENRDYRDQIDRLDSEIVRYRELELENRDLRNLLGLKQRSEPGDLVPVRVIGRDPSPYVQAIEIDRGSQDSIKTGMAVVTWRGLVGRVVKVESSSSKVLLISDINSSIMGRFQNPDSRATGLVRGRSEGGLVMEHIPQDQTIEIGELIITSDLGTLVPEGLIIGKVSQVRKKDVDVFQDAILEPAVDPSKIERLFVMTELKSPGN
jgi:rod shape-determining protein MreC